MADNRKPYVIKKVVPLKEDIFSPFVSLGLIYFSNGMPIIQRYSISFNGVPYFDTGLLSIGIYNSDPLIYATQFKQSLEASYPQMRFDIISIPFIGYFAYVYMLSSAVPPSATSYTTTLYQSSSTGTFLTSSSNGAVNFTNTKLFVTGVDYYFYFYKMSHVLGYWINTRNGSNNDWVSYIPTYGNSPLSNRTNIDVLAHINNSFPVFDIAFLSNDFLSKGKFLISDASLILQEYGIDNSYAMIAEFYDDVD